jgi:hypothetical protein
MPAQENTMNAIQSRRRFLGVLSAGAASAVAPAAVAAALAPAAETLLKTPAPAATVSSPDAALLQLVNSYLAADDERQRLKEVLNRARKTQEAKYPMPDVLRVRPEDHELELPDHRGYHDGLFSNFRQSSELSRQGVDQRASSASMEEAGRVHAA